eukprot:CAMPEP_0119570524 /NCGR_PEP_ID=MMETSP1352-20130426/43654_1 /TAXON_ID=265584 /ORGANISM="Stauroneis constricta, Strain CCMP1120" /LENGTH=288 /DNA_ID=CAMNT_0007620193 /DNA_START=450 /DNA_END=1316 /DNA_ORIENTATION=-
MSSNSNNSSTMIIASLPPAPSTPEPSRRKRSIQSLDMERKNRREEAVNYQIAKRLRSEEMMSDDDEDSIADYATSNHFGNQLVYISDTASLPSFGSLDSSSSDDQSSASDEVSGLQAIRRMTPRLLSFDIAEQYGAPTSAARAPSTQFKVDRRDDDEDEDDASIVVSLFQAGRSRSVSLDMSVDTTSHSTTASVARMPERDSIFRRSNRSPAQVMMDSMSSLDDLPPIMPSLNQLSEDDAEENEATASTLATMLRPRFGQDSATRFASVSFEDENAANNESAMPYMPF